MAQTVRIEDAAHRLLSQLSAREGRSMTATLTLALERYDRDAFLTGLASDFAELHRDPAAVAEDHDELAAWDATLADGLDGE